MKWVGGAVFFVLTVGVAVIALNQFSKRVVGIPGFPTTGGAK